MLPMTCDQKTGITFNLYVKSKIEYYQSYKTKNAFVSKTWRTSTIPLILQFLKLEIKSALQKVFSPDGGFYNR